MKLKPTEMIFILDAQQLAILKYSSKSIRPTTKVETNSHYDE